MTDVEGVGISSGPWLVEFLGGLLTAVFALGILLRISPLLTGVAPAFVLAFSLVLRTSFRTVRPIFRMRGKITAESRGAESNPSAACGACQGYHAEAREAAVFAAACSAAGPMCSNR